MISSMIGYLFGGKKTVCSLLKSYAPELVLNDTFTLGHSIII